MTFRSIAHLHDELRSGNTSCSEILQSYLENIEEKSHLNAFLEVFEASARDQASKIDEKIANNDALGELFGVVVAIKDNICYAGHQVHAASKILKNFESLYSSTVVERLIAADAIIIGRTNCDEFAMGSSNENSAFGDVLNPHDESRVPGGSSGGSAVAVAADLALVSLGSDTGGSIRQPAAFCGVYGFKPSYGRVSRHGLIAYASSFDQIGPFAKTAEDCALVYEVIAGADQYDSTLSKRSVPPKSVKPIAKKKKIAYFKQTLEHEGVSDDVRACVQEQIAKLRADGHIVEAKEFDMLEFLIPAYYILSTAEASSNLSRFDGIHYGYRSENATDIKSVYSKSRSEGFGKEVKNRIMLGTFVLSAGYYDAYYSKAQKVRRMLRNRMSDLFSQYDFVLSPTSPTTAFKLGEKSSDPIEMYLADIFTVLANLTGCPAISIPAANDSEGLPIGVQLMANRFEEAELLSFAGHIASLEPV